MSSNMNGSLGANEGLFPPLSEKGAYFTGESSISLYEAHSWPNEQVTVCMWIRWKKPKAGADSASDADTQTILNYGEDSEGLSNYRRFWLLGLNTLSLWWSGSSIAIPIHIADELWHHLAVSMLPVQDNNYQATVYVDGEQVGQHTISHDEGVLIQSGLPLNVGSRYPGNADFSGVMSNLSVWKKVRSKEQIQTELRQGVHMEDPDLAMHWPLDAAPADATAINIAFKSIVLNRTELLLEGRAYFTKFKELLVLLKNAENPTFPMPLPSSPTFGNLVVDAGAAGQKVQVIIWDKGVVAELAENGIGIRKLLRGEDTTPMYLQTKRKLDGRINEHKGNVKVFLEEYFTNSWASYLVGTTASSQHEKIAIFSVNGVKYALVGGFNIENAYWDDADHPMYGSSNHSWHDTALFLTGEAVERIEQEFDRRWGKSEYSPIAASEKHYAKIACWAIDYDACLDHDVCFGGKAPGMITADPTAELSNTPRVEIDVLRTNSESERINEIQQALASRILAAEQYVYMENFTFHDPTLVRALRQRLEDVQSLTVILMVPEHNPDDDLEKAESFFTRCAYLTLAIPFTEHVYLEDGDIVSSEGAEVWQLNTDEKGLEFSTFTYKKPNSALKTVPIYKIVNIGMLSRKLYLCAPYRRKGGQLKRIYVHSKLALLDDAHVLLGSANFNKRSMEDDGELSLLLTDDGRAAAIRDALFKHWAMDSFANWEESMDRFKGQSADGIGVLPLDVRNMFAAWPEGKWQYLSYFSYTSRWG